MRVIAVYLTWDRAIELRVMCHTCRPSIRTRRFAGRETHAGGLVSIILLGFISRTEGDPVDDRSCGLRGSKVLYYGFAFRWRMIWNLSYYRSGSCEVDQQRVHASR